MRASPSECELPSTSGVISSSTGHDSNLPRCHRTKAGQAETSPGADCTYSRGYDRESPAGAAPDDPKPYHPPYHHNDGHPSYAGDRHQGYRAAGNAAAGSAAVFPPSYGDPDGCAGFSGRPPSGPFGGGNGEYLHHLHQPSTPAPAFAQAAAFNPQAFYPYAPHQGPYYMAPR